MDKIVSRLFDMRDEAYRDFHARLVPTIPKESIIGVRTPQLRAYARELAKDPCIGEFLSELPHRYVEENNLHAWIVGTCSRDIETVLERIDEFLPYVDNWATCDMFAPKIFAKHPARVEEKIYEWIASDCAYTVRFAIVTLLGFYLDEHFRSAHLAAVAAVNTEDYYVYMAAAWYFSVALVKQWDAAMPYIVERRLDKKTHNMAIRKAIESFRISPERKEYLRTLRIK